MTVCGIWYTCIYVFCTLYNFDKRWLSGWLGEECVQKRTLRANYLSLKSQQILNQLHSSFHIELFTTTYMYLLLKFVLYCFLSNIGLKWKTMICHLYKSIIWYENTSRTLSFKAKKSLHFPHLYQSSSHIMLSFCL